MVLHTRGRVGSRRFLKEESFGEYSKGLLIFYVYDWTDSPPAPLQERGVDSTER